MPALVAGIHVFLAGLSKAWMAGKSPAMTAQKRFNVIESNDLHNPARRMERT